MTTYLEQLFEEFRRNPEFITQYAVSNVIADITETMNASGMSRSELADRAGLDPAQITRLLKGDHNMTVKTLGRIAAALGTTLDITMAPEMDQGQGVPANVIPISQTIHYDFKVSVSTHESDSFATTA